MCVTLWITLFTTSNTRMMTGLAETAVKLHMQVRGQFG